MADGRIAEQRRSSLYARKAAGALKPRCKELGRRPDRADLWSGDIEYPRRRLTKLQTSQSVGVCVPLPDHIECRYFQSYEISRVYFFRDVHQYPVTKVNRVIEAEKHAGQPVLVRVIFKDALPAEARLRVLANGSW